MNTIHTVGGPLHELIRTRLTYPTYVPFQILPKLTLEERNEAKRQRAIEWLGTRWILHPENQVRRIGDV